MFLGAAVGQGPLKNVPRVETRRALLIINLQNDSLDKHGDLYITQPQDFVQRIKDVVPYFRKLGDVVWIRTEFDPPVTIKHNSSTHDDNGSARDAQPAHAETEAKQEEAGDDAIASTEETSENRNDEPQTVIAPVTYHPTSRAKAAMNRASAQIRSDKRRENLDAFTNEETASSDIEDYLSKPRKGQQPKMYQPGTFGAAIAIEVLPLVDEKTDLVIVKNHYSAFDSTQLLLSLRMKLVTDVYLCGCLSNVSIYATAADAVRHGLNVTVVEDCIGYRSEAKHESAMRHMGDVLGVSGIDSEEIMEQSGGRVPPDADPSMITGPGADGIALGALSLAASPQLTAVAEEQLDEKHVSVSTVTTADVPQIESGEGLFEGISKPDAGEGLDPRPISGGSVGEIGTSSDVPSSSQEDPPPIPAAQPDLLENLPMPDPPAIDIQTRVISSQKDPTPISAAQPDLLENHATPDPTPATETQAQTPPAVAQVLGPGDHIGEGDSSIIHNVLEVLLAANAFTSLKSEVKWQKMHHRSGEVPRLVAVQGEIGEDGSVPIYRHPVDESPPLHPFSATLKNIKDALELKLQQPFNHALIQLYREGKDNISEHSDKACFPSRRPVPE